MKKDVHVGQEITFKDNAPVLFGPLSESRWQNAESTLDVGSTNIRRLEVLPDGRLVQLFPNTVKIGGIDHLSHPKHGLGKL